MSDSGLIEAMLETMVRHGSSPVRVVAHAVGYLAMCMSPFACSSVAPSREIPERSDPAAIAAEEPDEWCQIDSDIRQSVQVDVDDNPLVRVPLPQYPVFRTRDSCDTRTLTWRKWVDEDLSEWIAQRESDVAPLVGSVDDRCFGHRDDVLLRRSVARMLTATAIQIIAVEREISELCDLTLGDEVLAWHHERAIRASRRCVDACVVTRSSLSELQACESYLEELAPRDFTRSRELIPSLVVGE